MKFAEKLRELRESKGMSQKELATKSGTSQQGIANWETGSRVPAFDAVQKLCVALGCPCTVFDGCEHAPAEETRGRGRPPKAAVAGSKPSGPPIMGSERKKPAKGKKKK